MRLYDVVVGIEEGSCIVLVFLIVCVVKGIGGIGNGIACRFPIGLILVFDSDLCAFQCKVRNIGSELYPALCVVLFVNGLYVLVCVLDIVLRHEIVMLLGFDSKSH